MCVPNCGAFGWESDLVRVSSAMYASEYEIKVTREDFRRDAKKTARVEALVMADGTLRAQGLTPSQFWYAAPVGVIPHDELPEYAGLVELPGRKAVIVVKPAPRLHKVKLTPERVLFLTRGVALRYWDQRAAMERGSR